MSNVSYTTDIYAFSPFYRVSFCHPLATSPTTCQKILFHAFGAILYVCLHMLSSLLIYISTQSFNFAITVGLLYLGVSIVRHSKLGDGLYIVDVETGVDPTAPDGVTDDGHNGYDIAPRSPSYEGSGPDPQYESETEKEGFETPCEGESVSPPSTDPDTREDTEETPPETEDDKDLKEE